MQRTTLGKSGSEAASQLQGRITRAFSSNSLVNSMDITAAIQYILTSAQSLGDIWACWCIILRKRAGIDKMDYHMFRRKYLLGCLSLVSIKPITTTTTTNFESKQSD